MKRQQENIALPVLMYHGISTGPLSTDAHRVHVTQQAFSEQIAWLAENGYQTVPLAVLEQGILPEGVAKDKIIAITFDDGFKSQLDLALPILERYGFTATAFVVAKWCQRPLATQPCEEILPNDELLRWREVESLQRAGWEIGSHTLSHYSCADLTTAQLHDELGSSQQQIQKALGIKPTTLAFPYGKYSQAALDVAAKYYQLGFSTHPGKSTLNPSFRYRHHRIEVGSFHSLASFRQNVKSGFNGKAQHLKSIVRDKLYQSKPAFEMLYR